jgi:hypothetical protein
MVVGPVPIDQDDQEYVQFFSNILLGVEPTYVDSNRQPSANLVGSSQLTSPARSSVAPQSHTAAGRGLEHLTSVTETTTKGMSTSTTSTSQANGMQEA